jgi:hypothetical protein
VARERVLDRPGTKAALAKHQRYPRESSSASPNVHVDVTLGYGLATTRVSSVGLISVEFPVSVDELLTQFAGPPVLHPTASGYAPIAYAPAGANGRYGNRDSLSAPHTDRRASVGPRPNARKGTAAAVVVGAVLLVSSLAANTATRGDPAGGPSTRSHVAVPRRAASVAAPPHDSPPVVTRSATPSSPTSPPVLPPARHPPPRVSSTSGGGARDSPTQLNSPPASRS